MSIIYSHISGKHIDTDAHEVVELSNGDVIAMDDDTNLVEAFQNGLISADEMLCIGFEQDDLLGRYAI
jgi:hypothetical protein